MGSRSYQEILPFMCHRPTSPGKICGSKAAAKTRMQLGAAVKRSLEEAAVNRPGRMAGIRISKIRAPKVRHKISVPVLRTSKSSSSPPRPHGRSYLLPALRA